MDEMGEVIGQVAVLPGGQVGHVGRYPDGLDTFPAALGTKTGQPPHLVVGGQEAVARTMARMLGLPTTIARINASYGANGGLPAYHCDWVAAGRPIRLRAPAPSPYSPIHTDDMATQVAPLLDGASVPATIVNWCGDEVVAAEAWCALFGERLGVEPALVYDEVSGSQPGSAADPSRRLSLTGPCTVGWRDGMAALVDQRADGQR